MGTDAKTTETAEEKKTGPIENVNVGDNAEKNSRTAEEISAEHANQQGPKAEDPIKKDPATIESFIKKLGDSSTPPAENISIKDPERQRVDENRKLFNEAAADGRLIKLKPKGEVSGYQFTGAESPQELEKLGVTAKQGENGTEFYLQTTEALEKGQKIEPGNVILTRMKDGQPVQYEDYRGSGRDVVDRWVNKSWDKFDAKYDRSATNPDGSITAKVKADAAEVWAVALNKETDVKTSWGDLKGGELAQSRGVIDLMTNYDYDPKASQDNLKRNSDFAIVKGSEQAGNNAIDLGYEPAPGYEEKWKDLQEQLRNPRAESVSKVTTQTESSQSRVEEVQTKDGKVSLELDAQNKVNKVELADGTRLERLGENKWVANPDHPTRLTEWLGDVIKGPEGTPQFVYQYEKVVSQANLEVNLSDGSKLAIMHDGKATLPGEQIGISALTPEQHALSSIKDLNLDSLEDRVRIQGVESAPGAVNTNYVLNLTEAESQALRKQIEGNSNYSLVQSDEKLKPISFGEENASKPTTFTENETGRYVYDTPRPDHTATTAIVFVDNADGRLKVITGTRAKPPYQGAEGLPGGFVALKGQDVENVNETAAREVREETQGSAKNLELVRMSDARKDPRNQVMDAQYLAQITPEDYKKMAGADDVAELHSRDVAELLSKKNGLAFDHADALRNALDAAKNRPELRAAVVASVREVEFSKAIEATRENGKLSDRAKDATVAALEKLQEKPNSSPKEVEKAIREKHKTLSNAEISSARSLAFQTKIDKVDVAMTSFTDGLAPEKSSKAQEGSAEGAKSQKAKRELVAGQEYRSHSVFSEGPMNGQSYVDYVDSVTRQGNVQFRDGTQVNLETLKEWKLNGVMPEEILEKIGAETAKLEAGAKGDGLLGHVMPESYLKDAAKQYRELYDQMSNPNVSTELKKAAYQKMIDAMITQAEMIHEASTQGMKTELKNRPMERLSGAFASGSGMALGALVLGLVAYEALTPDQRKRATDMIRSKVSAK